MALRLLDEMHGVLAVFNFLAFASGVDMQNCFYRKESHLEPERSMAKVASGFTPPTNTQFDSLDDMDGNGGH